MAQRAARDASDNHVAVAEPNVRTTRSAALILCSHLATCSHCAHQGPSALAYEPAGMWRLPTVCYYGLKLSSQGYKTLCHRSFHAVAAPGPIRQSLIPATRRFRELRYPAKCAAASPCGGVYYVYNYPKICRQPSVAVRYIAPRFVQLESRQARGHGRMYVRRLTSALTPEWTE